jgi:hypothetical protein
MAPGTAHSSTAIRLLRRELREGRIDAFLLAM